MTNRLITFLIQEVVIMPTAKRGRKTLAQKNNEELATSQRRALLIENPECIQSFDTLDPSECLRGIKTVKGNVTAIVDLWEKVYKVYKFLAETI
jgi:hypothetical protein